MNMAVKIQNLPENLNIAPRNPEGRLREWAKVRWHIPVNVWPPESPMYAVLKNPGRATGIKSDGGLGSLCDRKGRSLGREMRALEVRFAVKRMPKYLRRPVIAKYMVPMRERSRSERAVAERLSISRDDVRGLLERAYGWLEHELMLYEADQIGKPFGP